MASIFLKIGKGVEVAAEDVIKWAKEGETVIAKTTPSALAALAMLFAGVEKAATDVQSDATDPLNILLGGQQQAQDFLAVWHDLKTLGTALGITKI